jgi:hypothetical protein
MDGLYTTGKITTGEYRHLENGQPGINDHFDVDEFAFIFCYP